jgi:hypothetical protein
MSTVTTPGDFWLDWNGDFIVTPSGSIQTATGWDRVRQRIVRRIISVSAKIQPDGTFTIASNIFAQTFGVGLGELVDQAFSQNFEAELQRRIAQGVLEDQDIDSTVPPSVVFQRPNPAALVIVIGVTLKTGQPGTISIQITP